MHKILIIEDNEQNMYLSTFILESQSYEVLQARNGHDGIELAVTEKPDLIILDIQLPGIGGIDVARELRKTAETMHIPIIAVTSYAMAGDRERILAAGCNGYIEKPINPETFVAQIRRHLGDGRGEEATLARADRR